jgi:hypothetical protein
VWERERCPYKEVASPEEPSEIDGCLLTGRRIFISKRKHVFDMQHVFGI